MSKVNMKSISNKLRDLEELKNKLSDFESPLDNNEIWSVQQLFQIACGNLLVSHQETALEKGVERDLWNFGFRTTITQLQSLAKDKKRANGESKEILNWFLSAASGFYLQLLNQICSVNSLDLIFRRKDSVYGLVGGGLSSIISVKTKDSVTKNALYLCQYCLIHLGDLARYRQQAKQAETYYRHAVSVAATCGHPYNQLALLEAGRGNRLASVFLYIRALCVAAPFPGAPSNLIQTMNKVLTSRSKEEDTHSEIKIGTLTRMTKEEYVNLFLHFHSSLFLKGDLESAKEDLPRLSSALSMLVATTALTRSSLVQMFAVNVFAIYYFSGRFTMRMGEENKKEEEKLIDPKECEGVLDVLEELMVGMLAALLLPVHTMKEPEVVLTYPALPTIRLIFEWVFLEEKLSSPALKRKQQIWPGLCTLVNYLQQPLKNFDAEKFVGTPLPEDWELQEFQPLQTILKKYKYRESSPRLSPEQYSLLRAKRFTDLALMCCQENGEEGPLIKKMINEEGITKFEASSNLTPPVEEVLDLERLTLRPKQEQGAFNASYKKKDKVGILKPQGSLERSKVTTKELLTSTAQSHNTTQILKDKARDTEKKHQGPMDKRGTTKNDQSSQHPPPTIIVKPKSTRTNVALQAILKRNSNVQESKQVTFQTPSPSASPNPSDASCESQRSQISSPPLVPPNHQHLHPGSSSHIPPNTTLSHPPIPPSNQNVGFPQRFSVPFRSTDHPTSSQNTSVPMSKAFPPGVSGPLNYPSNLNSAALSPRNDQLPFMGMRPPGPPTGPVPPGPPGPPCTLGPSIPPVHPSVSGPLGPSSHSGPSISLGPSGPLGSLNQTNPLNQMDAQSKGMYGSSVNDDNGLYQSRPQGLGGIIPSNQDQVAFSRVPFNAQVSQANPMYGNNLQSSMNWKASPQTVPNNIGTRSLQMMSSNFGDIFSTSQRPVDESPDFSSQNFPISYHQSFPVNPPKDTTSSLGMLMDVNKTRNSRSMGTLNVTPGNNSLNQNKNLVQMPPSGLASSIGPGSNLSNYYSGNVATNSPWWNKEENSLRNNAFQFPPMGTRPPFPGGSNSPPSLESGLPKMNMYQNPPGLRVSNFGDTSPSVEGNNSMRMSSTYSLFGPLGGGGGRESLQQPFPQNRITNPAMNPQQSQQHLQQQQQPQQQQPPHQFLPHHSLWSGPSPLQRLLEQKKFTTK